MKAITPEKAQELRAASIPDTVYQAINNLLVLKYNDLYIKITQAEVMEEIRNVAKQNYPKEVIVNKGWLNFENAYRSNGWEVKYIETGNPTYYEFIPIKK